MNSQLHEVWQLALSELSSELNKPSFETWFKLTRPVSLQDGCLIIEVPNDFTKEWFETRYRNNIIKALRQVTNHDYDLVFIISSDFSDTEMNTPPSIQDQIPNQDDELGSSNPRGFTPLKYEHSFFNPRYTFDTFVVGACNRLSHAASQAVAESPSRAYNPLFIYGGVGLGKTHLLHAIGQYCIMHHNFSSVFYFSSEKFTNEFINSIRDNKTLEFRSKYRNMDVLLIDDIQFLAGKEQTQEEFFHTFNALHEGDRQIIISSDRPPKEIPTLEDRLRSRFEWGLITDLQPPDLETRTAILKKKAISDGLDIPDQVIQYIAEMVINNIRELEGALIRIAAYASLFESQVTLELTEAALRDIIFTRQKKITIDQIIQATSSYYDVKPEDLLSKKRTQNIALTRQTAMYLSRMLTDLSLPKIGEEFGGRDHSTVLHAFKKIDSLISSDDTFKHGIEVIKNNILDSS